ncbi:hypothetical protein C8R45DRAFT_937401 [Mycena sanguinolenta]|nr:hypothetical protein C8R45DRAFT_937401 [Mycena sanguinolenta]
MIFLSPFSVGFAQPPLRSFLFSSLYLLPLLFTKYFCFVLPLLMKEYGCSVQGGCIDFGGERCAGERGAIEREVLAWCGVLLHLPSGSNVQQYVAAGDSVSAAQRNKSCVRGRGQRLVSESHSSLAKARSQSGVTGETPEGILTTLTWKFRTLYPFAGDSRVHNQDQGSRTETETKSESRDQDRELYCTVFELERRK